eukprot:1137367-Pelagomonas_calceolata.AAC.1
MPPISCTSNGRSPSTRQEASRTTCSTHMQKCATQQPPLVWLNNATFPTQPLKFSAWGHTMTAKQEVHASGAT